MLFTQRRGIRVLGSWDAACARMRLWNIETPSSGARKLKHGWKLLAGSPKKRGRGSATTPQKRPSPALPSNSACNRPQKPTLTRTGAFCELRVYGGLGCWHDLVGGNE